MTIEYVPFHTHTSLTDGVETIVALGLVVPKMVPGEEFYVQGKAVYRGDDGQLRTTKNEYAFDIDDLQPGTDALSGLYETLKANGA